MRGLFSTYSDESCSGRIKKLQTSCTGKVILPRPFLFMIIAVLLGRDKEGELEVKDCSHGNTQSSHL